MSPAGNLGSSCFIGQEMWLFEHLEMSIVPVTPLTKSVGELFSNGIVCMCIA